MKILRSGAITAGEQFGVVFGVVLASCFIRFGNAAAVFERVFFVGNKLYVGGLSWNTDNDGLREAFARFGEVEDVRVITDRETGRSRGFGFVTFHDVSAAQNAISEMDGKELDGRNIRVNIAEDKPRNESRGGDRRGGGGGGYGGGRW